MQRIIVYCIILGAFITTIVGFKTSSKPTLITELNSISSAVDCVPNETTDAVPFIVGFNPPPTVMIRKNVYSLTPAEIASIKTGIAAMKALPLTNPTSWQYQAAIHGTTLTNNLPQWNSCQHGTKFFFSWHRMYLYFFERILRAKSGNPNLTLPYWDYQTNAVLPAAYRTPAAGNTLYDPTRNSSINNGGALPNGPMTAITGILNNDTHFFDFNNDLQGPHGSIHIAIGGNMGAVNRAALDPCFWLHHTNIDRLWEKWLKMCGGRANPTNDTPWMTQVFTFFNENGQAVNMTGSQIVNTAAQLNYKYDLPSTFPCRIDPRFIAQWKFNLIELAHITPHITEQSASSFKVSFKGAPTENFKKFIQEEKRENFKFSATEPSDRLFIKLDGVQLTKMPEGVIELYVNLPAGEKPVSQSKFFAGVLDLFSISSDHMTGMKGNNSIRVNISNLAKAQGLTVNDLSKAELTFVSKGNIIGGNEIKTTNDLRIGNLSFIIEKPSDNH
jgi:tyrosinase